MYRVLLLDDEPNILRALRRCLAAIDPQHLDGEPLLRFPHIFSYRHRHRRPGR